MQVRNLSNLSRANRFRAALVVTVSAVAMALLPGATATASPASTSAQAGSIVDVLGKGGDGGGYLTAPDGRQVILRGLNTNGTAKVAPDCMPGYNETDIAREARLLRSNAVRLMIQWRCLEPTPNVYDDAYLDRIENLVNIYNRHGMTVLLDMHQDLYGPGVTPAGNVGNGAPAWAAYTDGLPVPQQSSWAMYYLTPGVTRAFDNFWNKFGNHPELMDHYAAMWAHLAARFADHRGVFGYDLMNEPFAGSVLPGTLESGALAQFYQKTVTAIRKVDTRTWIFLEPVALGANQGFASRLPRIEDPRPGAPKIGYAPHLYILGTEEGGMPGILAPAVKAGIDLWQANVRDQARRLSPDNTTVPILVGEYGLDTTKSGALAYIDHAQYRFGQMTASTFYYSSDPGNWGPWGEDGSPRNTVTSLSRCFAPVVAGEQEYQAGWNEGCHLRLATSTGGVTQMVVPGLDSLERVRVKGAEVVSFDPTNGTILVRAPQSNSPIDISIDRL